MPISAESKGEVPLLAVLTLVLWTVTCSVAAVGVLVPYIRPKAVEKKEMVVTAERLQVELTSEPIATVPEEVASTSQPEPPDLDSVVRPMEELSFTAVADPKLVQFAMPVEGPVRLVDVKAAAFAAPVETVKTNTAAQFVPAPQQLTYGQGEGRQPAPDYPYRARREGQEGVVKVRFLVGEDGRVMSAEAASPSPWPMLNDSAVRAVRERWRFRGGTMRNYEVAIRFQLR
jgi:protein TonB